MAHTPELFSLIQPSNLFPTWFEAVYCGIISVYSFAMSLSTLSSNTRTFSFDVFISTSKTTLYSFITRRFKPSLVHCYLFFLNLDFIYFLNLRICAFFSSCVSFSLLIFCSFFPIYFCFSSKKHLLGTFYV